MCKVGGRTWFDSLDVHRMGAATNETCRASEEGPIGNGGTLHMITPFEFCVHIGPYPLHTRGDLS